jgi:PAS domain S-box-containing protein
MDSSFVGIRISDKNDVTSYVNQAFLDIFGYENIAEVISSPPPEHYTPEAHASWVLRHKQLLRGEPMPKQVDIDILRKDGTVRHLDVSMRQVFWDGKQQYQTLYNDITERKLTEEALKASEQNFRNSIDSSLMGFRIVDSDWRTLYVNQVFLDIYGYKNIDDMGIVNPEELYTPREYARYVERQEQRKQGILVKEDYVEQEIIRRDGAIRYVQTTKSEVFWNGQKQYQILCNDITERKQVEEKLEQAAREWRTTFDSITDLIYIHDKDNRIIRVNKAVADMLHTTPKELIGKFCYEVMHGTQEPPVNCPHLQTIKTSKPVSIETFNPGLGLHFHESTSPLFNENGEIAGSVLVVRDVTQQKRIEEQLILSDRLASIGELSSGIAHELNNPLTSVIGFSQLLMEGDVPAYMKQDLETIHNEAERAAVIVKNLLTFGRKHAPVKQLSYINTVIEDVLKLRAYEEKVNNIKIEKHFEQNLPQIMMDHFQMQQVFLNIIVNAEFAMLEAHHKGMLTITTEKESDFIRISIGDDGLGISEENLKHIFDPFFTTKEVGKGTGLGLSICHGIVNEHGGKIYANSKKNQGTTFVVELPF